MALSRTLLLALQVSNLPPDLPPRLSLPQISPPIPIPPLLDCNQAALPPYLRTAENSRGENGPSRRVCVPTGVVGATQPGAAEPRRSLCQSGNYAGRAGHGIAYGTGPALTYTEKLSDPRGLWGPPIKLSFGRSGRCVIRQTLIRASERLPTGVSTLGRGAAPPRSTSALQPSRLPPPPTSRTLGRGAAAP